MINKKPFFKAGQAGFMFGVSLLITLSGCVGYVDGPNAGVYVAQPAVEVTVQDEYVYYPGYGIYFNSYRHQYAYIDGGVWVMRPEPRGVSVDVLLASPSVRMDFHDSPANHHAEIARQYPRNWRPAGGAHVERAGVQKTQVKKTEAPKAPVKKAPAPKEKYKDDKHEEK